MLSVVISGGIACGKSVVGALLEARGIAVCDADTLAHEALEPGSRVHQRVTDRFGPGFGDSEGRIDRTRLGNFVFAHPEALDALNRIIHPEVKKRWDTWLEERGAGGERLAVVIVPLLFEAGFSDGWDSIIVVATTPELQRERLQGRGWTEEKIQQCMNAQWDCRKKMPLADYVIWNTGTEEQLKGQALKVLEHILEK